MSRKRILLAVVVMLASGLSDLRAECPTRTQPTRRVSGYRQSPAKPAWSPAPAATCTKKTTRPLYCVCYPDAKGVMRLQGTTTDRDAAQRAAAILKQEGIQAWSMEMRPAPREASSILPDGEEALAIAFSLGPGKSRTVVIHKCGRAVELSVRIGNKWRDATTE